MDDKSAPDLGEKVKIIQVVFNIRKHQEGLEPEAAQGWNSGEPGEQGRHRQAPRNDLILIYFTLDVREL